MKQLPNHPGRLLRSSIAFALFPIACGGAETTDEAPTSVESAIVSGTLAQNTDLFPKSTVQFNGNGVGCSGTIIAPRHVLTANHCGPTKGTSVTFYNNSSPTTVSRSVVRVYEGANITADPTTGAPVDADGNISDWAVIELDSAIPTNYMPARLPSSLLPIGTKVYEVGVGTHDGVTPFGTDMRYHVAMTRTDPGACPPPMPANGQYCRGSVLADGFGNPGDSGGPLFTYTTDATKTGPLIVNGDMLTGDARYTSAFTHFSKIMLATGLSQQIGTLLGGVNDGSAFTAVNTQECAARCRIDTSCQAYAFTSSNGSCQFKSVAGVALAGTGGTFGIKDTTGPCDDSDAICKIGPEEVEFISAPVPIGPTSHSLSYSPCGIDGQTCALGGNKYVAYGANGNYLFTPASGSVACSPSTFGGDPAPGIVKTCLFANFGAIASEGATGPAIGTVAYGANGTFNFANFGSRGGLFTCNTATFGGDPIFGTQKQCYAALPDYKYSVSESNTLPSGVRIPVAFGANGSFIFGVLSGSASCSNATFGSDPAPGVTKACYRLPGTFLTNEPQHYTLSSSANIRYGSGFNGNFLALTSQTGQCSFSAFGGDPHYGSLKHCYAP